jgi:hypothetical protein
VIAPSVRREYPCEYPGQVPLSCNTIGAPKPKADVLADEDELLLKREVLRTLTGTRGYSRVVSRRAGGRGRPVQGHKRSSQRVDPVWTAAAAEGCGPSRALAIVSRSAAGLFVCLFVCLFVLFVCLFRFGLFVCSFVRFVPVLWAVCVVVCAAAAALAGDRARDRAALGRHVDRALDT